MNYFKQKKGFTIIELLVASSIFVIFLAVAIGSFTRMLQVERTLARRMTMASALQAAIESMAREIRIGQKFNPTNNSTQSLSFENFSEHVMEPVSVELSFDGGGIIKKNNYGTFTLTPSDVEVTNGHFFVSQTSPCEPWRITIAFAATPKDTNLKNRPEEKVFLQTTVTSRILPIDVKGDPYQCKSM